MDGYSSCYGGRMVGDMYGLLDCIGRMIRWCLFFDLLSFLKAWWFPILFFIRAMKLLHHPSCIGYCWVERNILATYPQLFSGL